MSEIQYKILERRQKLHIKTYALLCLVLIMSIGFYSFKKWQAYALAKDGIEKNNNFITLMRDEVGNEKSDFENRKPGFDQLNTEISKNLKTVFPMNDDYTNLTRQLDAFEKELAKKNDPFEVANIDYQSTVEAENYRILPLRMNIRSSRDNFTKFLHLIENSGALNANIRLMDVSSIKLNFENSAEESDANDIISFSLQLNAYFQK